MRTLIVKKTYIPKLSHRDNNTRKWKNVVFVLDKTAKKIKLNTVVLIELFGKLTQVRIVKICGEGWYEVHTR